MYESTEVKITEYNNKRLYLAVLLIVLLVTSWFLYKKLNTNISAVNNQIPQDVQDTQVVDVSGLPTLVAMVTVSSVNPAENSLAVKVLNISNIIGDNLISQIDSKELKININSRTTVQELIYETDKEGYVSKSNNIEVNLSDLKAGDLLYLTYRGEVTDDEIANIEVVEKRIATTDLVSTYEEEVKRINDQRLSYAKVKILNVDIDNKTLEYISYGLQSVTNNTYFANYSDNTGFYYIDDLKRLGIKHVRSRMNPIDVKSGDDVYINVSNESGEFNGPVQVFEVVKIKSI